MQKSNSNNNSSNGNNNRDIRISQQQHLKENELSFSIDDNSRATRVCLHCHGAINTHIKAFSSNGKR
jgi:hypothetical protein